MLVLAICSGVELHGHCHTRGCYQSSRLLGSHILDLHGDHHWVDPRNNLLSALGRIVWATGLQHGVFSWLIIDWC